MASIDVSSFLSGNYLTQVDVPDPVQVWTIRSADVQQVGDDRKLCLWFNEFPAKALAANKTNLARIVEIYGKDAGAWPGKPLLVYRSRTNYAGKDMLCLRVSRPDAPPADPVFDSQGTPVAPPAMQPATQVVPVNAVAQPAVPVGPVAAQPAVVQPAGPVGPVAAQPAAPAGPVAQPATPVAHVAQPAAPVQAQPDGQARPRGANN